MVHFLDLAAKSHLFLSSHLFARLPNKLRKIGFPPPVIQSRVNGLVIDPRFPITRFSKRSLNALFPNHTCMSRKFSIIHVLQATPSGMSGSALLDLNANAWGVVIGGSEIPEYTVVVPISYALKLVDYILGKNVSTIVHVDHRELFGEED